MALSTVDYSGSAPPYALVYAAMGVLVAGGLWCSWRVGTGCWGRGTRVRQQPPARWGVAEPGVDSARVIDGETMCHLDPGATVAEAGRVGRQGLARGADGLSGWVAEERPVPSGVDEAEGGSR
jgi:hypothetical protein